MQSPALVTLIALSAASLPAQACFDASAGSSVGIATNSVSHQVLGFPFPMPGGTFVTSVALDSHGRILSPGGTSDGTPSQLELLATQMLCPLWTALDPSSPAADDVYFFTDSFAKAVITWTNVVPLGGMLGDEFTFQAVIHADGRFSFAYDGRVPNLAAIIGSSNGSGIDPGAIDLSTTESTPFSSGATGTIYEQFGAAALDLAGKRLDFFPNGSGYFVVGQDCGFAQAVTTGVSCAFGQPRQQLTFDFTSLPRIGASFDLSITGIPPSTLFAAILVGSADLAAPLASVFPGNPCFLHSSNDLGTIALLAPFWNGTGDPDATYGVDLTLANGGLSGFEAVFQVVTGDPAVPWASGLAILSSNAILATIGI